MGGDDKKSLERQVLERAWRGTWAFFGSWQRDLAVFSLTLAVVAANYYLRSGWPTDWWAVMDYLAVLVAPVCILWLLLFVWHFWLAPFGVIYQAWMDSIPEQPLIRNVAIPARPINWTPWKLREKYELRQFARILVGRDPNGSDTNECHAYLDVLKQEVNSGKLKAHLLRDSYTRRMQAARYDTEIDRAVAIKWAKDHVIDISHIE